MSGVVDLCLVHNTNDERIDAVRSLMNLGAALPVGLERRLVDTLAGTSVPAQLFYPAPPLPLTAHRGRLRIEIVSHCWRYSGLLAYQLGSLVDYGPEDVDVTFTLFYSVEDVMTTAVLELAAEHDVPNLSWNFRSLPREQLFRRAIGRNLAALDSDAHWIWFTDCDQTFQAGCLDGLAAALQGRVAPLVFPAIESRTRAYGQDDPVAAVTLEVPELKRLPAEAFQPYPVQRATGPLQIAHGDVCRAIGYCGDVAAYQQPEERFAKCTEDRVFRWLLGSSGVAVEVPGVCRIQHADKGRYRAGSRSARLRRGLRGIKHRLTQ